jgi:hypothetical protein
MDDDEVHNQEENELENEDVVAADDVQSQVGNHDDNDDDREEEISANVHTVADDGADEDHHEADAITGVGTNEEDDNLAEADESAGVAAEETGGTNELDARYRECQHNYDLRPRKPRSYKHRHANLEDVMMTQLSLIKGLKAFGASGAEAVKNELQQLHDRRAMVPKAANMLSKDEKRAALQYLMYLKQKRNGKIKGRGCADGRKQRVYKSKEESSSPTVAIESLFLTATIDAKEGRSTVTCNIPGAFLHADMDEVLHMRIDGPMAKLLLDIDRELYAPFMTEENGKPVIYVKLEKALYGTLQAALLFWRNLSGFLMEEGFTLNPYDECGANKMINGQQCTIVWHVDDLKISHVSEEVTEQIVELLQVKYGSPDAPVTVTRGKVHDYLGMTLDYSEPGKVAIRMDQYVNEFLSNVPEDMLGTMATPAAAHIYEVNPNAELLDPGTADRFHTLTAKLLFLCKRARPDLQQAMSFLTTRVKKPEN